MPHWSSLPSMFFSQAEIFGKNPLLWKKSKEEDVFKALSWIETAQSVSKLSSALRKMGVTAGDRVALLSENRPEWVIADLAIMSLGAVSVPFYTTYTTRDHLYVLENSGAKIAVVSTKTLAEEFLPAAIYQNVLKHIVTIEDFTLSQNTSIEFHSWSEIIRDEDHDVATLAKHAEQLKRDDLACIIYTSGTGGAPKGVMLHHGALLHNCEAAIEILKDFLLTENRFLSFLPLSHAYGHMGDLFLPIAIGAEIYFAESLEKLSSNMLMAKPTVMLVVPRLFETLKGKIEMSVKKSGGVQEKAFQKTLILGRKRLSNPGSLSLIERAQDKILDLMVRKKIKARFGGHIKALVSGGAALNPEIGSFFSALGLTVLQGYGQTETAPLVSVNCPPKIKFDAVGPPVRGAEVSIAEDGEILVRGELVMKGYWRDEEATRAALHDGWLHTGDIGFFDRDGHLKITDRKKDIIVFDKGDNISPQKIESLLTLEPEIAQAMVFGDNRPYLVGLVVPDSIWLKEWAQKERKICDLTTLSQDSALHRSLSAVVERVNSKLSTLERVRKFLLATEPFSVENEMITPTLKIRRHAIKKIYGQKLEALY